MNIPKQTDAAKPITGRGITDAVIVGQFKQKSYLKIGLAVVALVALLGVVAIGLINHYGSNMTRKEPLSDTAKGLSGEAVVKVAAPKPSDVEYAKRTVVEQGVVTLVTAEKLSIKTTDGRVINAKLTPMTIYQMGAKYVMAKKDDVTLGKSVKIVYDKVSKKVDSLWFQS